MLYPSIAQGVFSFKTGSYAANKSQTIYGLAPNFAFSGKPLRPGKSVQGFVAGSGTTIQYDDSSYHPIYYSDLTLNLAAISMQYGSSNTVQPVSIQQLILIKF